MKRRYTQILAGLFLVAWGLTGCMVSQVAVRGSEQSPLKDEINTKTVENLLSNDREINPNTVISQLRWMNKNALAIDFLAYEINERIFGAGVRLNYDSSVLEYVGYKEGDFLEQGGIPSQSMKPVYLTSNASSEGENAKMDSLIIGATLFRGTPGVNGSGRLFTLHFRIKQDIDTTIILTKGNLKNLQAEEVNGINWPNSIPITRYQKH